MDDLVAIPELVYLSIFLALGYGAIHSFYDYYNPPGPHTTWIPVVIGVAAVGATIHLMIFGVTGDLSLTFKYAFVYSVCYLLGGLPMILGQVIASGRRRDGAHEGDDIDNVIDRIKNGRR